MPAQPLDHPPITVAELQAHRLRWSPSLPRLPPLPSGQRRTTYPVREPPYLRHDLTLPIINYVASVIMLEICRDVNEVCKHLSHYFSKLKFTPSNVAFVCSQGEGIGGSALGCTLYITHCEVRMPNRARKNEARRTTTKVKITNTIQRTSKPKSSPKKKANSNRNGGAKQRAAHQVVATPLPASTPWALPPQVPLAIPNTVQHHNTSSIAGQGPHFSMNLQQFYHSREMRRQHALGFLANRGRNALGLIPYSGPTPTEPLRHYSSQGQSLSMLPELYAPEPPEINIPQEYGWPETHYGAQPPTARPPTDRGLVVPALSVHDHTFRALYNDYMAQLGGNAFPESLPGIFPGDGSQSAGASSFLSPDALYVPGYSFTPSPASTSSTLQSPSPIDPMLTEEFDSAWSRQGPLSTDRTRMDPGDIELTSPGFSPKVNLWQEFSQPDDILRNLFPSYR